jgi:Lysyl oxidase
MGRSAQTVREGAGGIRRRATLPVSLLSVVGLLAFAPAALATPILPDLVADAPIPSKAPEVYVDGSGSRLLIRLDGYVHNAGAGPLDIRGTNNVNGTMTSVSQLIYDSNPAVPPTPLFHNPAPRVFYESADFHNHFHLRSAMRYSMWNSTRTAEAAPGQKVGFCLVDSEPVEAGPGATPVYKSTDNHFCEHDSPSIPSVFMGVSAGWRDYYSANLSFQWIDASDVAPGQYWMRTDADPDGVVQESNEVNTPTYAATPTVVNGYLAQPVNAGTVGMWSSKTINLQSTKYDDTWPGSPGAVQYKIVTAPTKGTLNQPVGTWFSATSVKYTPKFLQSGADSFTVAARDGSSAFPLTARTAPVSITISGLFGVTSTGTPPRRTRPAHTTPVTHPVDTEATRPAPSVAPQAVPPPGRLSKVVIARHGRALIASVTAGASGHLRFVATNQGVTIGSCTVRARKGTDAVCLVALPHKVAPRAFFCTIPRTSGLELPGVKVSATLTSASGRVVRRSARAH